MRNLEIKITSERKGGNPGGNCIFNDGKNKFEGYFKYCIGSNIRAPSSFVPENQPFYEATTFELVRKMGLATSKYFVLLNENGNLNFVNCGSDVREHSGRKSYFISKIQKEDSSLDEHALKKINEEKVYLNSLEVSDVIGRRQNYRVLPDFSDKCKIMYIDLGCSFVNALDGNLKLSNGFAKINFLDKRKLKKLKKVNVIGADNYSIVNFGELVEGLPSLVITTLNPLGKKKLKNLVSSDEISEIQMYLTESLYSSVPKFREKDLLL